MYITIQYECATEYLFFFLSFFLSLSLSLFRICLFAPFFQFSLQPAIFIVRISYFPSFFSLYLSLSPFSLAVFLRRGVLKLHFISRYREKKYSACNLNRSDPVLILIRLFYRAGSGSTQLVLTRFNLMEEWREKSLKQN